MWKRLLILLELDDADETLGFALRLAPQAERISAVLVVPQLQHLLGWPDREALLAAEQSAHRLFGRMRALFGAAAADVELLARAEAKRLAEVLQLERAEVLLVGRLAGTGAARAVAVVDEACSAAGVAGVWAPRPEQPVLADEQIISAPNDKAPTAIRELLLPLPRPNELASVAALLRDRCGREQRLTVLAQQAADALGEERVVSLMKVAGIGARAALRFPAPGEEWAVGIARAAAGSGAELITLAPTQSRALVELLAATPCAVLVAPRPGEEPRPAGQLGVCDALVGPVASRVRLELASLIGGPAALPDQEMALIVEGREVAKAWSRGGLLVLPAEVLAAACEAGRVGIGRSSAAHDALAEIEASLALVGPSADPITLADTRLSASALSVLCGALADARRRLVLVRLRPEESFSALRQRLASTGAPRAAILDISALLDEGASLDVPRAVDAVRLARLAARMRVLGFAVDSAAHPGEWPVDATGLAVFAEAELRSARRGPAGVWLDEAQIRARVAAARKPLPGGSTLDARLDECTGSRKQPGNKIALELRNDVARRSLIDAIGAARERVHLQTYIAHDDPVSDQIEHALVAAAGRGVRVRMLADSVYSLHGSFGAANPLLTRLAAREGIEVRAIRPIVGVPSVADLKQRDHRKLVLIDGERASVGGRNLAREYFLDFSEVQLNLHSPWNELPWLDAGAWVEGPVLADLERSFRASWTAAGGAPFPIVEQPRAGEHTARVVLHHGLRDARTLEVYLALIDSARRSLEVVNTFPIQLELQHALLGAVARGVRVRALFGNPRPLYGDIPFPGAGALRELGNQLVRARIDALVEAGGEAFEFAVREVPGWDPALGVVRPHVHAKIVCADGEVCALGSANLDITASYWESEVLLVVQDAAIAGPLAGQIEMLCAAGVPVDRTAPHWKENLDRRAMLSRWWPSMIG